MESQAERNKSCRGRNWKANDTMKCPICGETSLHLTDHECEPMMATEELKSVDQRRLVQRLFSARAMMAPHHRERDNGKLILDCCEVIGGAVLSIAHLEECLEAGAKIVKQDGQWCLFADNGNGIKCRDTLEELLTDLPPLNVQADLPATMDTASRKDVNAG
jgi:hypothetical protein